MSDFDSFVNQLAENKKEDDKFNKEEFLATQKNEWITHLNALYEKIEQYLDVHIKNGNIVLTRSKITLYEEQFGNYEIDKLEIAIANQKVEAIPIGTFLIGAKGRVDIKGKRGSGRFVLVDKTSTKFKVNFTVSINGVSTKKPKKPPAPEEIEWEWKIASTPPSVQYLQLNEDSFKDTLMGIINA